MWTKENVRVRCVQTQIKRTNCRLLERSDSRNSIEFNTQTLFFASTHFLGNIDQIFTWICGDTGRGAFSWNPYLPGEWLISGCSIIEQCSIIGQMTFMNVDKFMFCLLTSVRHVYLWAIEVSCIFRLREGLRVFCKQSGNSLWEFRVLSSERLLLLKRERHTPWQKLFLLLTQWGPWSQERIWTGNQMAATFKCQNTKRTRRKGRDQNWVKTPVQNSDQKSTLVLGGNHLCSGRYNNGSMEHAKSPEYEYELTSTCISLTDPEYWARSAERARVC